MIGTDVHLAGRENVLRLEKNSQIRIIERVEREIAFCVQKL